ncbi:hypothetical protein E2320_011870 [Naja naja]|nr:hypothetical protein E2320_011870 [Naja naja]
MPQIIRADVKTAAGAIPPLDIPLTQSEGSMQDFHRAAKEPGTKGGSLGRKEKGHFKMPKFKWSSLSWSFEKEASLETNEEETLDKLGGRDQPVRVQSDEGISEEIQIEESQGRFKLPRFTMLSFGRPSKAKMGMLELKASLEKLLGLKHLLEL